MRFVHFIFLDHNVTLSPIMGSELFMQSFSPPQYGNESPQEYKYYNSNVGKVKNSSPKLNAFNRPNSGDVAMREYYASRAAQQEVFDTETFSLNSAEEVSGIFGRAIHH